MKKDGPLPFFDMKSFGQRFEVTGSRQIREMDFNVIPRICPDNKRFNGDFRFFCLAQVGGQSALAFQFIL